MSGAIGGKLRLPHTTEDGRKICLETGHQCSHLTIYFSLAVSVKGVTFSEQRTSIMHPFLRASYVADSPSPRTTISYPFRRGCAMYTAPEKQLSKMIYPPYFGVQFLPVFSTSKLKQRQDKRRYAIDAQGAILDEPSAGTVALN